MSKPDGIPDDVWGMTEKIHNQPFHWKGPMEVAIIVAHAIMAERERCERAIRSCRDLDGSTGAEWDDGYEQAYNDALWAIRAPSA